MAQDVPVATTAPQINLRQTVTVDVVKKTKDAVVYISTTKLARTSPFGDDPFFRQFFQQNVQVQSLGSGFIVHEDGYVVTNNHVIDRAREIHVDSAEGKEKLPAELIAADPDADLAILKIKSDKPLPYLELGDSSDLMIGEPVIAVGNPLGYSHSVSTGIVSAVHRSLGDERVKLEDLIQTDAAINPGNSGGPLLNAYGQVIGINTAIRGDAQNIGFAIQVNKLRDMIPDLLNPSQAAKLDMPIKLKEIRKTVPPSSVHATIVNAENNTPIESIAGKKPIDIVDAYAILLAQKDNEAFSIALADGKKIDITPHAAPMPDAIVRAKERLGMTVEELTPTTAQKYGLIDEDGMLVTQVARGSVAARAGIQPGDVILQLGRYPVNSLKQFSILMQHLPESGNVRIGVARGQQRGFLMLQI